MHTLGPIPMCTAKKMNTLYLIAPHTYNIVPKVVPYQLRQPFAPHLPTPLPPKGPRPSPFWRLTRRKRSRRSILHHHGGFREVEDPHGGVEAHVAHVRKGHLLRDTAQLAAEVREGALHVQLEAGGRLWERGGLGAGWAGSGRLKGRMRLYLCRLQRLRAESSSPLLTWLSANVGPLAILPFPNYPAHLP